MPHLPTILKLDKRLVEHRAVGGGPQFLPRHAGEVEDRHGAGRRRMVGERAGDGADEPDRRPDMVVGGERSQFVEIRHPPA